MGELTVAKCMGFSSEMLWGMGYYGVKIPTYQLGNPKILWGIA